MNGTHRVLFKRTRLECLSAAVCVLSAFQKTQKQKLKKSEAMQANRESAEKYISIIIHLKYHFESSNSAVGVCGGAAATFL